jgi:predicted ATPase/class 3 adenylate cyclase
VSEIRALLLTDVVDSTKLSERLGDEATAALWAAHDRSARDLLPRWRGREIDKTDGMLLLFESAGDAVGYALAYHRSLMGLVPSLTARAGLHVGPVVLRENNAVDVARGAKPLEVDGTSKALAARVMAIANGGQTLLSGDAREALGKTALRVESHGHWRMKGVAEPIEIFEVGDAGGDFVPPADGAKGYCVVWQDDTWLPAADIPHNLPAEVDSFVGRHETLIEVARRFDAGAHLVSITGVGGTGKTRLATRFARTWLGDFPDGAWFCDLSQARSADGIVFAVAQGLDVPLGEDDPVTQLGHAIEGRGECLVILDNFEQVARHAEATLAAWMGRAPQARFLVTTREVLGLRGEEVLALAPLSKADAEAMFARRAEAANPEFKAGGEDPAVIERLVELLDCLPLAIELAAARVRVMAPAMLLSRMGDRFSVLSSAGGRHDRQATLRTVFDWSWELLSFPEESALAQLSVFEGGFTLESVEAVVDLTAHTDGPLPMDALQSLVQKSFVRGGTKGRFDLLVSVKEYAAEHLRSPGRFPGSGAEAHRAAELRHGAYFAALATGAAPSDLVAEADNLVAACRRAAARGDTKMAADLLERAWSAIAYRGPFSAAADLASLVASTPGLAPEVKPKVHWLAGRALAAAGKHAEARAEFETSLARARETGDRRFECSALAGLATLDGHAGRMDAARAQAEAALAIATAMRDAKLRSESENVLGVLETMLGHLDEGRAHFEAALALAKQAGEREREGRILANLGILHLDAGRLDQARLHDEAALAVAREIGETRLEATVLSNLGLLHQVDGSFAEALVRLQAALARARELGFPALVCLTLCNLGIVCDSLRRYDDARRHLEEALGIARALGDRRAEGQTLTYLGLVHAHCNRFDEARRCLAESDSLLRALSDRLSLGLLLCSRVETEHLAGSHEAAAPALAEARAIAAEAGAGPTSELGLALARVEKLGKS